ncbi:hypothetical protein QVD99_006516 [Batrachochytrium dendrobatidis]|nr:hypothetical protein QVD99_006516 [Batrachochytrium dendrobatidis]
MVMSFITSTSECMRINFQTTDTSNDSCKCIDRVLLNNSSVYKSASLEIVNLKMNAHFKPIHQSQIRLVQYSPVTCIPFLQRLVHRIHVYSVCCFDCDLHQPRIMESSISFVESVHNVCFNVIF